MADTRTKVVVLGATGMLGNAAVRVFAEDPAFDVIGVARSTDAARLFAPELADRIVGGLDAESQESLTEIFARYAPDLVINCVGLVKQLSGANRVLEAVPINTTLPHRLARLCKVAGARLVHVSTDCVFTGEKGGYTEADPSDARDLYGVSKFWGEVDEPQAITLRTSIIGHEMRSAHGLLGWFLEQSGTVRGFRRAIFSGLPTGELARVIRDHVVPRTELHGVYHVSAEPIAKYDLLHLFAKAYRRDVEIEPDDALVIDRSLDSSRFRAATGYVAPPWPELIDAMRNLG